LGVDTTTVHVDEFLNTLPSLVDKARKLTIRS
jgi:hypothetical protein